MARLSVNINKIATIRNARGGNNPDLLKTALDCERFGAQGITVHPRPDERHIRYQDVLNLKPLVTTEFNIEGNHSLKFMELVHLAMPAQVTLVPDADNVLTSDAGWDIVGNKSYLAEVVSCYKEKGIRVSVFVDPVPAQIEAAAEVGAHRIELYTGPFAHAFAAGDKNAVFPYVECSLLAGNIGLGVNAGHDLDLNNLGFLRQSLPFLDEVSIGHALICDALYFGLENTIQMYLREL